MKMLLWNLVLGGFWREKREEFSPRIYSYINKHILSFNLSLMEHLSFQFFYIVILLLLFFYQNFSFIIYSFLNWVLGTYVLETHNPEPLISISTRTLLIFAWFFHLSYSYIYSGAYEGGRAPLPPSYPWADGSFNITSAWIYPSQAFYRLHFIALHSPKLKD